MIKILLFYKYFKNQKIIAEGKLEIGLPTKTIPCEYISLYEELENNKCKFHDILELLKEHDGKNIKLIIEEK